MINKFCLLKISVSFELTKIIKTTIENLLLILPAH
jgi:hypothetical protein